MSLLGCSCCCCCCQPASQPGLNTLLTRPPPPRPAGRRLGAAGQGESERGRGADGRCGGHAARAVCGVDGRQHVRQVGVLSIGCRQAGTLRQHGDAPMPAAEASTLSTLLARPLFSRCPPAAASPAPTTLASMRHSQTSTPRAPSKCPGTPSLGALGRPRACCVPRWLTSGLNSSLNPSHSLPRCSNHDYCDNAEGCDTEQGCPFSPLHQVRGVGRAGCRRCADRRARPQALSAALSSLLIPPPSLDCTPSLPPGSSISR